MDTQGMGFVVLMPLRSWNRGRYQSTLQFKSVRKRNPHFRTYDMPLATIRLQV